MIYILFAEVRGKKCPKLAKNKSFLKFSETVRFERVPLVQKFFIGYYFYTYILTQLMVLYLKLCHANHICINAGIKLSKNEQKLIIIDHTNTLHLGISENNVKSTSFSDSKKSNFVSLLGRNVSFVYYILLKLCYKTLFPKTRWLKNSTLFGFQVISTPATPSLYTVLASKLKLK